MATVEIRELIKPETGEKFYPYAHLNGVKGAELLPRIGGSVQTTLPTPIFQVKDALNAQFYPQTHAQAVIGLAQMIEDNQFFEKESDGNGGFRIKLKDGFTGLYADGWVASGGVGSGGSGGGGLIESVLGVADLDTPIVLEDLSETFSAKAIQTIWDAVKVLQNTTPNVSLVNGANNSTLTVNGTTADFYTKSQIDAIVGAAYRPAGNASSVSELGTLTAANIGKVYNMTAAFTTTADFLEGAGKSFPAGTNVVIVDAGSGTYKYDVLSGFVDLSGYAQKVSGATNGNFAGLDANGNLTDSGHKHGDYVTALGTSGNNLTWTKNGQTSNITVPFATNATTATKVGSSNVGHSHRPIYLSSGTPTQVTDVASDFIGWPYANHGTMSSLEYLTYMVGPNVFAYPKTNYIDVEYTRDGGTTWVDYGCTDAEKTKLFTTSFGVNVGKKGTTGVAIGDAVRITVHEGVGTYGKCEYIALRHYCPNTCDIKVEYTTYAAQTTWVEHTTLSKISGNPGYRIIPFSKFIFGNNGVHDLRITLTYNSTSSSYVNLVHNIAEIHAYCSYLYSYPSTYAYKSRLYDIDENKNAIFPAGVYTNVNGSDLGSSSKRWKLYATTGDFNGNVSVGETLTLATATSGSPTIHFKRGTESDNYYDWKIQDSGGHLYLKLCANGSDTTKVDFYDSYATIGMALRAAGAITLTGSTNTERRIYFGDTNHYLELDEHGFHFSHGVYSDDFVSAGGIGNGGGSGSATELGDLVDVALTTPDNGDLLVYNLATSHWENKPQSSIIPSVSIGFNDLTSHPTTLAGYGITDAKIDNGVITLGGNTITPLSSHQSVTLASGTNNGTLKLTTAAGTVDNIAVKGLQALAYKASLSATDIPDLYALGTKVTDAPGLGILLGVSVMSANLATSADNDASRVQWDHINDAWHFYGNVYVDGFLASGGTGDGGGGGGYGVEEITSNEDGTVDFHFTGGDVTTVDLNHEHPQYASKMAETSQPSGGFLPDVVYELGTLTGSVTFALASAVSGQVNHYFWTFTAGSTAPTITWPSGITWADSAPTITASKKYQISILDGIAAYMEA